MKRDVILKVGLCVCAGIALGSMFIFLVESVNEHSAGEPDEPGREDYWMTPEWNSGGSLSSAISNRPPSSNDNEIVLKFEAMDPDLTLGGVWDPLMFYDASEKHWTLSDRFLEDVADALVPVLKERGFLPIGNKYKEEYFMMIRENSGDE